MNEWFRLHPQTQSTDDVSTESGTNLTSTFRHCTFNMAVNISAPFNTSLIPIQLPQILKEIQLDQAHIRAMVQAVVVPHGAPSSRPAAPEPAVPGPTAPPS